MKKIKKKKQTICTNCGEKFPQKYGRFQCRKCRAEVKVKEMQEEANKVFSGIFDSLRK